MDREIVDAVTEWETTASGSGYEGLHQLASRSFSGAITAGGIWAFMLNGRVVGLVGGSLSAFDGRELTAYVAPDPALALLYTMQQSDREKEAAYYTNRTSISEVDQTLSTGGFTGYIELSENVHSGDYYIVYYGGNSMSVAFVGNQRRLLTEDEAFQRADDEVGIYDVYAVDIDVTPLPDFESSTPAVGAAAGTSATDEHDAEAEPDTEADGEDDQHAVDSAAADDRPEDVDGEGTTATVAEDTPADDTAEDDTAEDDTAEDDTAEDDAPEDDAIDDSGIIMGIPDTSSRNKNEAADASEDTAEDTNGGQSETDRSETAVNESAVADEDDGSGGVDDEEPPAVDNEETPSHDGERSTLDDADARSGADEETVDAVDDADPTNEAVVDADLAAEDVDDTERTQSTAAPAAADEPVASLRAELEAAKQEISRLKQQLSSGSAVESTAEPTRTLSVEKALAGTNLFVRYDSKGKPTLATVHDGAADHVDAETVNENLRIDHHTTFDTDGLAVDGQPFATVLADRIEMGFADWLVRKLPFEIRDTRNQNALGGVYDALPEIDRVELRGEVVLGVDDEGTTITETYDMVVRDKMGEPLFIVQIEDSPQPTEPSVIEQLIRDGNELSSHTDAFSAVFVVSTSYYGPAALEAVSDATSGGLLSRNKKKAYVSVSRKRGFHVCLADRLNGEFDLRVPEL